MSFAFLPLYTGDYLRDTRHLSPLRHGVYLLLLMHCWDQKGPLPLDEQEVTGIANCRSADEVEALRYIVDRYFVRMEDGYYNRRINDEIERAEAISGKRSHAGRAGANERMRRLREAQKQLEANAKQMPSNCLASDATPTPTPTPTPTTTTTKSKHLLDPDGFERFWAAYPRHVAKARALKVWHALNPPADTITSILSAVVTARATEQWRQDNGKYIPHPATWLNQRRWEDELTPVLTRRVAI